MRMQPSVDPLTQIAIILTDDLKLMFYQEEMNQ